MIFTATTFDPSNPATWLGIAANGGLALVVFFAFIKGWVVPGFILDRAEQRIKDQDAQIAKITDVFQQEMIPALTKSTNINENVYDYLAAGRVTGDLPRPRKRA